jgi:DNA-binding NarL/FixJ family response regulator
LQKLDHSLLMSTIILDTTVAQIKIAIADDHKIFRDGIKMSLAAKEDLQMLWEAEDGKDMMHKISIKMPEVLLMDIRMPEMDGINALEIIKKEYGEIKIIVLTMYDDQQMINRVMEMGANAYLTKTTDPEEIYAAILSCVNEEFYFNDLVNNAVMGKLVSRKNVRHIFANNKAVDFSEKEIKILQLLAADNTTEEISKAIFLSPRTVETIRQNMKIKVNAKTVSGLIMYAIRNKIIE